MLVCTFGIFSQILFHSIRSLVNSTIPPPPPNEPISPDHFYFFLSRDFGSQNCLSLSWTTPTFTLNVCANFFLFFFARRFFLLMNKKFRFGENRKKKNRPENMNNFQTNFVRILAKISNELFEWESMCLCVCVRRGSVVET